jgi:hypothetical protein
VFGLEEEPGLILGRHALLAVPTGGCQRACCSDLREQTAPVRSLKIEYEEEFNFD